MVPECYLAVHQMKRETKKMLRLLWQLFVVCRSNSYRTNVEENRLYHAIEAFVAEWRDLPNHTLSRNRGIFLEIQEIHTKTISRRRRGDYKPIFTEPKAKWIQACNTTLKKSL